MTDKVQKILSEIATRKLCTMDEHMAFYNDKAKEDYEFLSEIEELIKALQKEPVSEELEDFALQYAGHHAPYDDCMQEVEDAVKAGAKWQKEQFENNRLKHCNSITNEQAELEQGFIDQHLDKHQRIPTYLDAIEYGMNLQKEQMIKNAVNGIIDYPVIGHDFPNLYPNYRDLKDYCDKYGIRKDGKVKVIIINEDDI